jgi:hypothetical protein
MGAVSVFNPDQVPAFVKRGELSATAKALAGGDLGGDRISIKGGTFRLIVGGKEIASIEERYLDVVIVSAAKHVSRTWYATKWSGTDDVSAPSCWSTDGKTPDPKATKPQHTSCAGCPQDVKGSGEGDRKACRYQQRVGVVLANDIEGTVLSVTVPAKSLFGKGDGELRPLQEYARWLAAQNVDPTTVVTRMRFDTSSESPKLFFKPMRWLTDDEFEVIERQRDSEAAKKAVEFSVQAQGDTPMALDGAPPARAAAPAPAPAPAPAADDEPPAPAPKTRKPRAAAPAPAPAEEVPEPEVRKEPAKPTAVPPKASSLAAAIADWDDE